MTTTTIPVRVTEEAAAFIEQAKLQPALEQMLDHAKQTIPGLRVLEVRREWSYEGDDELGVTIEAYSAIPAMEAVQVSRVWREWKLSTFSPDVCRYLALLIFAEIAA